MEQIEEVIQKQKRLLEKSVEHAASLESLLECSPVGIAFIDGNYKYIRINRPLAQMNGLPIENHIGKTVRDVLPQAADFIEPLLSQVIQSGNSIENIEFEAKDQNGNPMHVLGTYFPVKTKTGKTIGVGAVVSDVTSLVNANESLKSAHEELSEKAKQLQKANTELDRFAAIAAHDLKAPLLSITQFTELLASQYRGRFDQEADEYISFIISAGNRMKSLIDNLLEYSRAGHMDHGRFKTINTFEVIASVRKNLLADISKTDARIMVNHDLPQILGDELQIVQLFQNIIANAIKFRKPHQAPQISIDYKDSGDNFLQISIQDQGIGIDPKYADRIFEVFNKVHGHGQYEGSGIGLAVCKRIIEAHGGKIWVESTPEFGSTFHFTLPKAT